MTEPHVKLPHIAHRTSSRTQISPRDHSLLCRTWSLYCSKIVKVLIFEGRGACRGGSRPDIGHGSSCVIRLAQHHLVARTRRTTLQCHRMLHTIQVAALITNTSGLGACVALANSLFAGTQALPPCKQVSTCPVSQQYARPKLQPIRHKRVVYSYEHQALA